MNKNGEKDATMNNFFDIILIFILISLPTNTSFIIIYSHLPYFQGHLQLQ